MAQAAVAEAPPASAPAATDEAQAEPAAIEWAPNPRLASPTAEPPAATDPPAAPEPPAADVTPPAEADASAAAAEVADWKAKLDAGDSDLLKELLTHPKLAGHIGTMAQRQAAALAEAQTTAAREAELDRVAQEDPDNPLAQARLAQRTAELNAEASNMALSKGVEAAQAGVVKFLQSLPQEAQAEVAKLAPEGKTYGQPGDLESALAEYMADVTKGIVAAELAKAKAAWEKETIPGLRKEILAEQMTDDRSPDLGTSARTGSGASGLTDETYAKMSPAELRKLTSTAAGRAQIDAMWASPGAA